MKKILLISTILLLLISCKKNKAKKSIDEQLYQMAQVTDGFTWYKNSDEILAKSSSSAHPQTHLRTRYNSEAANQLESDGTLKSNASFPEGSLIVKELINTTELIRYAILYKNASNEFADAKGWVWGYVEADGKVASPASNKGSSCINCHSQEGNIDYMLMNKYFP